MKEIKHYIANELESSLPDDFLNNLENNVMDTVIKPSYSTSSIFSLDNIKLAGAVCFTLIFVYMTCFNESTRIYLELPRKFVIDWSIKLLGTGLIIYYFISEQFDINKKLLTIN